MSRSSAKRGPRRGSTKALRPNVRQAGQQQRTFKVGELGLTVTGATSTEIADYMSAWWDVRNASQMLYSRSLLIASDPAQVFSARALWDAATVTYGRCFSSGRRRADLSGLISGLSPDDVRVHRALLRWRDKYAAHRVDQSLETATVSAFWKVFGSEPAELRVALRARVAPEEEALPDAALALTEKLANAIYPTYLIPLRDRLLTNQARQLEARRADAPVYVTPPTPEGMTGVDFELGRLGETPPA